MLPARSHATSVGRLKLEPGVPDPGARRPPPAGATAAAGRGAAGPPARAAAPRPRRRRRRRSAAAAGCAGRTRDRFRLAAEHERDAALGVELHHLVGAGVDGPDVVLRIDAQTDRGVEAVDVLPELAHELAGLVELEQPRAAAIERAVVAERRVRMAGARVDEDLALRIGADAGDLADVDVGRRLQQVGVGVERESPARRSGRRAIRRARATAASDECRERAAHDVARYSARRCVACGFSRIFCERQLLISAV